jgi:hypothetical protein
MLSFRLVDRAARGAIPMSRGELSTRTCAPCSKLVELLVAFGCR